MFLKKKPVTFRFVTANKSAYTFTKPERGTKFFPKWWKDLAKGHKQRETTDMTHCHGFLDLYKKSIILPMWSYLKMDIGPIGTTFHEWSFADQHSDIKNHPQYQRGSFLPEEEHQHLKLISPWWMECDEDVAVSWQAVNWRDEQSKINVLSAIVTPKDVSAMNINIMLPREDKPTVYEIDAGDPLVQLIPLTEREFKIEHHYVSQEEFERRAPVTLHGKYAKHTKALKFLKEQSKCPFGGK